MERIRQTNQKEITPIMLYLPEKTIKEYSSEEIEPKNLPSQTPKNENTTIIEKITSFDTKNTADTISSQKEVKDSTNNSEESLVNIKVESMTLLSSMLENENFETGIANPSEKYFKELVLNDSISAFNGLSTLFMDNYSIEGREINNLVGILHILSHMTYDDVYPLGQMMAISALSHTNKEVAEFGVKCFENWDHPDGIEKLKAINFATEWLQDYANDVIEELSVGG